MHSICIDNEINGKVVQIKRIFYKQLHFEFKILGTNGQFLVVIISSSNVSQFEFLLLHFGSFIMAGGLSMSTAKNLESVLQKIEAAFAKVLNALIFTFWRLKILANHTRS